MKLKILMILFIALPFSSYGDCVYNRNAEKRSPIRIDMKQYKVVGFDDLVKTISCIQLKSMNKTVFDSCERMVEYKDYWYLMVRTIAGSKIVIFKKTGEFVKEIVFSDAILLNSLTIVPEQEQLWVVSRLKILNKFTLDGTLIGRINLPFPCVCLAVVNNHNFLIYDGGGINNIEGHFMALTDFKSIYKLYLSKGNKKKRPFSPQSMFVPDVKSDRLFVFPDCTDTIYVYDFKNEELFPCYMLDFHGDFLTRDMYPDGGFSDKEMSEIITKRKYIYSQYCFYQTSGYLFFKLVGKRSDFCAINLRNNSLLSFNNLFDEYQPTTYNPFVGSDGKKLYYLVRESDLVKHYKRNRCTYPAIQKLMPSLSVNGNSWIMLSIEIKNGL